MKRIALHSVPRSGSSWVGSLLNAHEQVMYRFQPLFSDSFDAMINENSSKFEIIRFFDEMKRSSDPFINQLSFNNPQKEIKTDREILVYKEVRYHHLLENMLEQDEELIVIGLIRNPLAVIHSWLNAPKEFRKDLGWRELEEWEFADKKNKGRKEEYNGYAKWKEAAQLFERLKLKYNSRFYLLNYNTLLADTHLELIKLFDFLGVEFTIDVTQFINDTQSKNDDDKYSVYRTKKEDNDWVNGLNPIIVKKISEDLKTHHLSHYNL